MARRYTAQETLDYLLHSSENEESREPDDTSDAEEDCTEADPHFEITEEQNSDEDSEEESPEEDPNFLSKNGEILWSLSPSPQTPGRARAEEIIRKTPGPTRYACSRAEDIKSTFELYFPRSIQNILVRMTNLEGRRVFRDQWSDIDWMTMEAFIGLLILAGVFKSHDEATRSLWHGEMGRAIFRANMPLKDFERLSSVVRFDDKSTRAARRETDKLAPIRELWEKWVERLPMMYNPDMNVTVDECLIGFRGRCPFKQYMPSKPAKYGLKIWAACDAKSSYSYNMQVYTGKPPGTQHERNLGKRVVLELIRDLEGHIVTCDNFFTSYGLGTELLQRKVRMIGTVRKNKPELPSALVTKKNRTCFSSLFAFTETHTIVSYCPKKRKNVILMSTAHKDAAISEREDRKPTMILDYNSTKGGVDNLDKIFRFSDQLTLAEIQRKRQKEDHSHPSLLAEANGNATEAQSDMALILSEIKANGSRLEGITNRLEGIAGSVSSLQNLFTALTERIEGIETRLTEAEGRISSAEDSAAVSEGQLANLLTKVEQLQSKVDDLENRGRRKNLRIVGLPEGAEGSGPLASFLHSEMVDLPADSLTLDIERAHRSPSFAPSNTNSAPRSVLVRFLRFTEKEIVLKAALKKARSFGFT
ncbi:piggyBac transposable element-derived protein 4-like [Chanodichthys erythropterus]|uniref:piggyBac transposable element-derived protein 4-like n=1 Tax=Chanodichthys erythropterus TaxID=933992 RepID=UPI00351DFD7D